MKEEKGLYGVLLSFGLISLSLKASPAQYLVLLA